MTLTLEITPEMERELAREAEVRGIAVPALAARLLEDAFGRRGTPISTARSPFQVRTWIDSLAEFSDRIPAMEGETFSRQMLYQESQLGSVAAGFGLYLR
jgi:hypothetical protein